MICVEIKLGFTDGTQGLVEASIKSSTFDDSLFECDGDLFFFFFLFCKYQGLSLGGKEEICIQSL